MLVDILKHHAAESSRCLSDMRMYTYQINVNGRAVSDHEKISDHLNFNYQSVVPNVDMSDNEALSLPCLSTAFTHYESVVY